MRQITKFKVATFIMFMGLTNAWATGDILSSAQIYELVEGLNSLPRNTPEYILKHSAIRTEALAYFNYHFQNLKANGKINRIPTLKEFAESYEAYVSEVTDQLTRDLREKTWEEVSRVSSIRGTYIDGSQRLSDAEVSLWKRKMADVETKFRAIRASGKSKDFLHFVLARNMTTADIFINQGLSPLIWDMEKYRVVISAASDVSLTSVKHAIADTLVEFNPFNRSQFAVGGVAVKFKTSQALSKGKVIVRPSIQLVKLGCISVAAVLYAADMANAFTPTELAHEPEYNVSLGNSILNLMSDGFDPRVAKCDYFRPTTYTIGKAQVGWQVFRSFENFQGGLDARLVEIDPHLDITESVVWPTTMPIKVPCQVKCEYQSALRTPFVLPQGCRTLIADNQDDEKNMCGDKLRTENILEFEATVQYGFILNAYREGSKGILSYLQEHCKAAGTMFKDTIEKRCAETMQADIEMMDLNKGTNGNTTIFCSRKKENLGQPLNQFSSDPTSQNEGLN